MQIDWSKAPDWAQFVAMDADGRWHWYECEPDSEFRDGEWMVDDFRYEKASVERTPTWKDTLQRRPTE